MFKEYIKQSVIMALLRNGNFHSVIVCILIKNQSCQERSKSKTDVIFNFFQAAKLLIRFLKRKNAVLIIEFFLQQRT